MKKNRIPQLPEGGCLLGARMDELRQAVQALVAEAQNLERQMSDLGGVPSRDQLEALQKGIDRLQRGLNAMQTAMDTWSEEKEEV